MNGCEIRGSVSSVEGEEKSMSDAREEGKKRKAQVNSDASSR
jgi:hypothetical protein